MGLIDAKNLKRAIMDSPFLADWCKTAVNRIIDAQTTADAEPVRHGEWEFIQKSPDGSNEYRCTECKRYVVLYHMNCEFCPHCGAKMDGSEVKE